MRSSASAPRGALTRVGHAGAPRRARALPWLLFSLLCACQIPGPSTGTPRDGDGGAAPTDAASCLSEDRCPPCGAGEECIARSVYLSGFEATCLRRCAGSGDCDAGQRCLVLFGVDKAVCVSGSTPRACAPLAMGEHCDLPPATCRDATTLSRPLSILPNHLCGWELLTCPGRCASAGAGARCE